jgi:hypothetical protein
MLDKRRPLRPELTGRQKDYKNIAESVLVLGVTGAMALLGGVAVKVGRKLVSWLSKFVPGWLKRTAATAGSKLRTLETKVRGAVETLDRKTGGRILGRDRFAKGEHELRVTEAPAS